MGTVSDMGLTHGTSALGKIVRWAKNELVDVCEDVGKRETEPEMNRNAAKQGRRWGGQIKHGGEATLGDVERCLPRDGRCNNSQPCNSSSHGFDEEERRRRRSRRVSVLGYRDGVDSNAGDLCLS